MTEVQQQPESRLGTFKFELDRREALPALVGRPEDFLFVSGLAGASKDVAALTDDGDNAFTMAGAMGAAVSIALGLALAQPDRRVLAVTGDGELLMNVGTLATVAVLNPGNLSILCIDNGHYGETGYQRTHTSFCTDLETVARGCGITNTLIVDDESGISAGAKLLRTGDDAGFVLLRVRPTPPADYSRDLRPDVCRSRFRSALSV